MKISQKRYKERLQENDSYAVSVITKGGEQVIRFKIDHNKRHSKNNTIIGWNIYRNKILVTTLYK